MINLDIGHFVSAGYDPVEYLKQHHDRIVDLHIKDRNKAHDNLPFGQGETPIKEVLLLLKKKSGKSRRISNTNTRVRTRSWRSRSATSS